jgi:signal transduction histidine kinase
LVPALEGLCRSLSEFSHLSISFEAAEVPGLPDAVRVTLYRFLQEALTNVAKHSGASRVHVKLEKDGDAVALSVQDDGQGIDPEVARRHPGGANGLGIPSIRERLEGLGGRLRLESQPGQGTRLVAQIPVAEPG